MVEHINEQGDPNFNVGGVKREMPPELQLEQLASYIHATYEDGPAYLALLPDRITHAAMHRGVSDAVRQQREVGRPVLVRGVDVGRQLL